MRSLILISLILLSVASTEAVRQMRLINDGWNFHKQEDSVSSYVHIPHCWNTDAYSTKDYYRGKGIYTRSLRLPISFNGGKIYLKFDGIATSSDILIDGLKVGSTVGAYSSNSFDVTPFLIPGKEHLLTVVADNSRKDIPPYSADFSFMGGIYRDVWMLGLSDVHFDVESGPEEGFSIRAFPSSAGKWGVEAAGTLINESKIKQNIVVRLTLTGDTGSDVASVTKKISLASESSKSFSIMINDLKDMKLWSPEHPNLYKVEVEVLRDGIVLDSGVCSTAFRTFGFDEDGRFLLNGRPLKLRGMCRHQDRFPMGIALLDEQHRIDARLAKDMGANFIRISHYPQDDALLEMCDRLGLIAWEEIPVIDYVPDTPGFDDNCESMLRAMIRRHRNHPSIAMWGYMNEILLRVPGEGREASLERTRELARRLEAVVREEDPDRLTTMAFHGSDSYHDAGLAEITDVKGWNLYQGWYGGRFDEFEKFLSRQHREHPDHRLIVSEYGAGSDLRVHSFFPKPFDFSMEYQQKYLEHYLPVIEDSAFVAGASHWNLIDFSSANRQESMPHINNKGILTNDRRKKDIYYYFSAKWHESADDTVVHIAADDWKYRTDLLSSDGKVVHPVKVYTNLPQIALKVNDNPISVKSADNCTAVFDVALVNGRNSLIASDPETGKVYDIAEIFLEGIPVVDGRLNLAERELGINVGSDCWFRSDDTGMTWIPDREYIDGSVFGFTGGRQESSTDEILLTSDDPLLQTCRKDLSEYRFDVVPGDYEIELLFAELAAPNEKSSYLLGVDMGEGKSEWTNMDILINGNLVEHEFSPGLIGRDARLVQGGSNSLGRDARLVRPRASGASSSDVTRSEGKFLVRRRYLASAPDGIVRIAFNRAKGSTHLSAVKIRKL